jgi:hypothetical protein
MTYEELIRNLQKRHDPLNRRNSEEARVVEKLLLDITREKIRWWKPWKLLTIIRKLRQAVFLFGQITYTAVSELENLRQTQLDTLQVQRAQQDMLVIIKDRLQKLER